MSKSRKAVLAAVAVVSAGTLAACGSGGGGSAGGKDPIVLGSLLTIQNQFWQNGPVQKTTQAFADYINKELGGIQGRKIQIESCDDKGDGATGTQCATNMLAKNPVAFVNNSSLVAGQVVLPQLEAAKMPLLGGWPISQQENASKYEFPTHGGSSGTYPGLAVFLRSVGAKNIALVFEDNAAANAIAKSLQGLWKTLGGEKSEIISYGADVPDFSPLASQVAAAHPDGVIAGASGAQGIRLLKALNATGLDVPVANTQTMADEALLKKAGSAVDGMYFDFLCSPTSFGGKDVELYEHVMSTYAPDQPLTPQTCVAASGMEYALQVLKGIDGDITKESVLKQAEATTSWPGFMTHPMADSYAPEGSPAIRNPFVTIAQYKGGTFEPVKPTDVTDSLKPYIDEVDGVYWFRGNTSAGS